MRSGTIGPAVVDIAPLYKDLGVFTYDPGLRLDRRRREQDHLHRRRCRRAAAPRLSRSSSSPRRARSSRSATCCCTATCRTSKQLEEFTGSIRHHTMINESLLRFFNGFHHNAHPMAMVSAVVASMSAFYHDTMDIHNPRHREIFAHRIVAKIPTIAAAAHKHSLGQPFIYPRNDLDYCSEHAAHVLRGALRAVQASIRSPPRRSTCCSSCTPTTSRTPARRPCGWPAAPARIPTRRFPRACRRSGVRRTAAPTRPCSRCSSRSAPSRTFPKYLAMAKDKSSHFRLMGFGHRVYKNFDPRAKIIRAMCHKVLEKLGQHGQSAVRAGAAARGDRAQGRILRRAQALSERRFLLGHHLQRARHPALDVHGDVRDRAHRRLGGALAGDDLRSRPCASAGRASSTPARRSATTVDRSR